MPPVNATVPAPARTSTIVDNGHTGVARVRRAPEWSDIALFAVAVLAIWLTRRALRRRMRKG